MDGRGEAQTAVRRRRGPGGREGRNSAEDDLPASARGFGGEIWDSTGGRGAVVRAAGDGENHARQGDGGGDRRGVLSCLGRRYAQQMGRGGRAEYPKTFRGRRAAGSQHYFYRRDRIADSRAA